MNDIVRFRLCTLTDEELLDKVDKLTDEMFTTQKVPSRHIPARPNEDLDLLIGELIFRHWQIVKPPEQQSDGSDTET